LNIEILDNGWEVFRMQEEFNKMIGISTEWRISPVNNAYRVNLLKAFLLDVVHCLLFINRPSHGVERTFK